MAESVLTVNSQSADSSECETTTEKKNNRISQNTTLCRAMEKDNPLHTGKCNMKQSIQLRANKHFS